MPDTPLSRISARPLRRVLGILLGLTMLAAAAPGFARTEFPVGDVTSDRALVEFNVPNRTAIDGLIAMDVDLAEYVREESNGTLTINAWVTPSQRLYLESLGYRSGATIEDRSTWLARVQEREEAIARQETAHRAAEGSEEQGGSAPARSSVTDAEAQSAEVTVMRADYFSHRSGTFLSVEARTSLGTNSGGPTLAMSWREESGAYGTATSMSKFTDAGAYMYHRMLVRIGPAGATSPIPFMVRVASSTTEFAEKLVAEWVGEDLPPLADDYMMEFFDHYMDPVEVYQSINDIAAEFPDLAEIIDLPYQTEGYQRRSMAIMSGTDGIGAAPSNTSQAVLLIAKSYGQEGGNDVQAEFLAPLALNAPLTVAVADKRVTVSLATTAPSVPTSTASQVVSAINASAAASALVTAYTYAGNAGTGVVQTRLLVNLSDFLAAPPNIPRGHFQPQAIRIGKHRDGSKVGVFLYCQQHAREWVTPLVCAETAQRLLKNYAIDPLTQELVDNLDIFIVPSYNPDGSLYSFYDFASQRKNMTRHCPLTGTSGMPPGRNSWGVDINRNQSEGSIFDGYSGGSSNCTGETYSGPSEVSEPESQNERWLVDTFENIRFSNNIHSYGGYFMWAPGAYKTAGRVTLPAPNIGIEGYFFEGAGQILTRIKEYRGTVILPGRTGPVADVLYSAAGNSADEEWYRKQIIAYSFETGADLFSSSTTGTTQTAVGFMPNFASEGFAEYNEFAAGNLGLLETALEYSNDTEAPQTELLSDGGVCDGPVTATFHWVNEPSVIHYTTDGSTPTLSSPTWEAQGPRQPGQVFEFDQPTTLKWLAEDIKGNVSSVQSRDFDVAADDVSIDNPGDGQVMARAPYGIAGTACTQNPGTTTSVTLELTGPQPEPEAQVNDALGSWTSTIDFARTPGDYTLTSRLYVDDVLRSTDNVDIVVDSETFAYDVAITAPAGGQEMARAAFEVTGTASTDDPEADRRVSLELLGPEPEAETDVATDVGSWSHSVDFDRAAGAYTLVARLYVGGDLRATSTVDVTVAPTYQVAISDPSEGQEMPRAPYTVQGTSATDDPGQPRVTLELAGPQPEGEADVANQTGDWTRLIDFNRTPGSYELIARLYVSGPDTGEELVATDRVAVTVPEPDPEGEAGKVTGGGQIASSSGDVTFGFNAQGQKKNLKGNANVVDHGTGQHIKATTVTSVLISGNTATIEAGCRIDDGPETACTIYVVDRAEPGRFLDEFHIQMAGYSEGGTLTQGNIKIYK